MYYYVCISKIKDQRKKYLDFKLYWLKSLYLLECTTWKDLHVHQSYAENLKFSMTRVT